MSIILEKEKNALKLYVYKLYESYIYIAGVIAIRVIDYYNSLKGKYSKDPQVYSILEKSLRGEVNRIVYSLFSDFKRKYTSKRISIMAAIDRKTSIDSLSSFRYNVVFKKQDEKMQEIGTEIEIDLKEYTDKLKNGVLKYTIRSEKTAITSVFKMASKKSIKFPKKYVQTMVVKDITELPDMLKTERDLLTSYLEDYTRVYANWMDGNIDRIKNLIYEIKDDPLSSSIVSDLEEEYAVFKLVIGEYIKHMKGVYSNWITSSDSLQQVIKNKRFVISKRTTEKSLQVYESNVKKVDLVLYKYIDKYNNIIGENVLFDPYLFRRFLESQCEDIDGGESESDGGGESGESESESESDDDVTLILQ